MFLNKQLKINIPEGPGRGGKLGSVPFCPLSPTSSCLSHEQGALRPSSRPKSFCSLTQQTRRFPGDSRINTGSSRPSEPSRGEADRYLLRRAERLQGGDKYINGVLAPGESGSCQAVRRSVLTWSFLLFFNIFYFFNPHPSICLGA